MNEPLYTSQKDEDRKNLKPVTFEPDSFDFTLRRTLITTQSPVIAFNSQDGATEEDVLNRSEAMQTGYVSPDTSELVRQQVDAQNAAIDEAQRLAALKNAMEAQAIKDAEAVQAKIKYDAEVAFAASIQQAANKKSKELAEAAEIERQRALADEQRAAELLVVQRANPASLSVVPSNVAMTVDLATETGAKLQENAGTKIAEAVEADLSAQRYGEQQTQKAAAEQLAMQELSEQSLAKGEAMGFKSEEGKTDSQVLAEAAVVQKKTVDIIQNADRIMKETNDRQEYEIAQKAKKDAEKVQKVANSILNDDDIFDIIAKWIIKTVKL